MASPLVPTQHPPLDADAAAAAAAADVARMSAISEGLAVDDAAAAAADCITVISERMDLQKIKDDLFHKVMDGDWDAVVEIYGRHSEIVQTAMISRSKQTALHIAISDNKRTYARKLLDYVEAGEIKEMKNERENNPLHLAASLGHADVCTWLVKKDLKLIKGRNKEGETPLFLAALHGRKDAFYALHPECPNMGDHHIKHSAVDCRRNDGNTILHVAIIGEFFDLAFQIMKWYPNLIKLINEKGWTALHFLAKKPSAFRSGCHFGALDDLVYRCSIVNDLPVKSPSDIYIKQSDKSHFSFPENYKVCIELSAILLMARRFFDLRSSPCKSILEEEDVEKQKLSIQSKSEDEEEAEESNKNQQCEHDHFQDVAEIKHKGYDDEEKETQEDAKLLFPPNYFTFFKFLEFVLDLFLIVLGFGLFKTHRIREKKWKHAMASQVMKELVRQAGEYEYEDNGSKPKRDGPSIISSPVLPADPPVSANAAGNPTEDAEVNEENSFKGTGSGESCKQRRASNSGEAGRTNEGDKMKELGEIKTSLKGKMHVEVEKTRPDVYNLNMELSKSPEEEEGKERSPILVAAKMGVAEIVDEILNKFPVAIEDENLDKKNVVLLSVENRQPHVYTLLKNKYATRESLFQKVDKEGNSALHLAATLGKDQPWLIPGAALQMQWELKWYEFINESMPRHFFTRLNDKNQTPKEVFTETHKDLVKDGATWLTSTSNSCSVVAALIATVAFTSATTLPGGVKQDSGTPTLEGRPAFSVFAISSLIALCSSVTALTMFLSILTSRYQVPDFRSSLPAKLILGLTSLFISIASMLISFCAGHFFVLEDQIKYAALPVYTITCLPVKLFAMAQFPLYLDLLRSITASVPKRSYEVVSL